MLTKIQTRKMIDLVVIGELHKRNCVAGRLVYRIYSHHTAEGTPDLRTEQSELLDLIHRCWFELFKIG